LVFRFFAASFAHVVEFHLAENVTQVK